MNILHVLYNYVPDKTGSTTRSRGLLAAQKETGLTPFVITSPFQEGINCNHGEETVEGIPVFRTKGNNSGEVSEAYKGLWVRVLKFISIIRFSIQIYSYARKNNVHIVHAHSMFYCGFSAWLACVFLRVPLIYEVRSVWQDRFKDEGFAGKISYRIINFLEHLSCRIADRVVVISDGLRAHVEATGISGSKITVVPNAVSDSNIRLGAKCVGGHDDSLSFAYVGNISSIEGLEQLVKSFDGCFKSDFPRSISLKIYGRGPAASNIQRIINETENTSIEYKGEFSSDQLLDVYSDIDVVVIPRLPLDICRKVTPLKPLEALAFGKRLIMSDLPALREVVRGFEDNVIFFEAGNEAGLREALLAFESECASLDPMFEVDAKDYILKNRSWRACVDLYADLYSSL